MPADEAGGQGGGAPEPVQTEAEAVPQPDEAADLELADEEDSQSLVGSLDGDQGASGSDEEAEAATEATAAAGEAGAEGETPAAADPSSMKVAQLKVALAALGLPVGGNKTELALAVTHLCLDFLNNV